MKKQYNKQKLFEVMQRLDKTFKYGLNEDISNEPFRNLKYEKGTKTIRTVPENYWIATVKDNGEIVFDSWDGAIKGRVDKEYVKNWFNNNVNDINEDDDPCWDDHEMVGMKNKDGREVPNCVPKNEGVVTEDPSKEEMQEFLRTKYHTEDDFDVEAAIYWFTNGYHGGQNSNLYSALSTSEFRPSPMSKGIEDEESEMATMMYQDLIDNYGEMNENIHNTPQMGGILNSKGTAGYDPDATNDNQKTGKDFYDPEKEGERLKRLRSLEEQDEFIPHGTYTVSNAGGYEIMLSDDGDQARVRDAFGSDNPETSDWLEIEWVSGKPVIDPYGYNIPMSQVMRIR